MMRFIDDMPEADLDGDPKREGECTHAYLALDLCKTRTQAAAWLEKHHDLVRELLVENGR